MSHLVDLCGQIFGRWTVLARHEQSTDTSAYWLCRCECGITRAVCSRSLRRGASNSCGCLNRELALTSTGTKSPGWKGGKFRTGYGYVLVQAPEHPAAQRSGYVPEHRLVMETMIGRTLYPEENVHHINGIRNDNRPENLELWTSKQPPGQRVEDLVAWAQEILQLYGVHQ